MSSQPLGRKEYNKEKQKQNKEWNLEKREGIKRRKLMTFYQKVLITKIYKNLFHCGVFTNVEIQLFYFFCVCGILGTLGIKFKALYCLNTHLNHSCTFIKTFQWKSCSKTTDYTFPRIIIMKEHNFLCSVTLSTSN